MDFSEYTVQIAIDTTRYLKNVPGIFFMLS